MEWIKFGQIDSLLLLVHIILHSFYRARAIHIHKITMGSIISSLNNDDLISSSIISSQLVHRHTLSTCYDSIFDISLSSKINSILLSDDGRLRLFNIDLENNGQLIEKTISSTKTLANHEQILDIVWCIQLDRYLVLTSKRLAIYEQDNNLINLDLQLEKGFHNILFE